MPRFSENFRPAKTSWRYVMKIFHKEYFPRYHGKVICHMTDIKTGETQVYWEKDNIVTRDAGIQMARLFADNTEPNYGAYMLAVGTGATGALLAPDAPDERQRKLNAELARKTFASVVFRDASGNAVSYFTNIVDFTTEFGEAEAVGPLNEMAILSPISSNPAVTNPNPNSFPTYDSTVDVSLYDVLLNYLTFSVISKPSGSRLAFTWRFTF